MGKKTIDKPSPFLCTRQNEGWRPTISILALGLGLLNHYFRAA
jgi:hypothetical protein